MHVTIKCCDVKYPMAKFNSKCNCLQRTWCVPCCAEV